MQKKLILVNDSKKKQVREGFQLSIIFLLIAIALSLFFYLSHLLFNLPIIFFKASGFAILFTLGGCFFFLVEIVKTNKRD
jgi:hypothetical protein